MTKRVGLRSNQIIELIVDKSKKLYPVKLRVVEFYGVNNDELLTFLTNNLDVLALEVAYLYKNRWQIEIFFKWIKQNLTVKKLWGHSENAVKILLWVPIYSHLIVAYVKHLTNSPLSIYEVMQVLNTSLFDKTSLVQLLNVNEKNQIKKNQDVKELFLVFKSINNLVYQLYLKITNYGFHTGLHPDYHKFTDHSDKANYEALTKIINFRTNDLKGF